ncbi:porin family protein [Pleionea sediminis]|uniref:porin family protein n=1 Tax=Pleionea sediminis TaxID=2569479 RepID=UPI0011865083|nr:porin family protein [Pleionea sediminis]
MKFKLSTLILSSALSASAFADDYVGANYAIVDVDSAKPTALSFKYGKHITNNIVVEGRLGLGLSDDELDFFTDVKAELDNMYGVYGVYRFMPKSSFDLYGLVGFTKGKVSAKGSGFSVSESESDLSYGLGFDIKMSDSTAFNLEWARLIDKDDLEATTISAGVTFKF